MALESRADVLSCCLSLSFCLLFWKNGWFQDGVIHLDLFLSLPIIVVCQPLILDSNSHF